VSGFLRNLCRLKMCRHSISDNAGVAAFLLSGFVVSSILRGTAVYYFT
jgi:hypothetical protein